MPFISRAWSCPNRSLLMLRRARKVLKKRGGERIRTIRTVDCNQTETTLYFFFLEVFWSLKGCSKDWPALFTLVGWCVLLNDMSQSHASSHVSSDKMVHAINAKCGGLPVSLWLINTDLSARALWFPQSFQTRQDGCFATSLEWCLIIYFSFCKHILLSPKIFIHFLHDFKALFSSIWLCSYTSLDSYAFSFWHIDNRWKIKIPNDSMRQKSAAEFETGFETHP